jgi:hypothetical protein
VREDQAALRAIRADLMPRLDKAGNRLAARCRQLLGKPGTDDVHSQPGEPPREQTGELAGSIHKRLDEAKATVSVGSDDPVGTLLEFGTEEIAPRSWLRRAVAETADQMAEDLAGR